MDQPNTAFFHPGNPQVRIGIRADELYEPHSEEVRQGILLGSAEPITVREGEHHFPAKRVRKGSQVVWTHDGEPLPTIGRSLLASASIVDVQTARGGIRHLLSASRNDGKHLVLIQTGLTGTHHDHLNQILGNASQGLLPQLHGSVAIDDGSRALSAAAEGELPLASVNVVPPRRLRWWRPRSTLPSTDNVRARIMDLWELAPGAELLVRDIFPGRDFRIVIRNGEVVTTEAPKRADELFAQWIARKQKAQPVPEEAPAAA